MASAIGHFQLPAILEQRCQTDMSCRYPPATLDVHSLDLQLPPPRHVLQGECQLSREKPARGRLTSHPGQQAPDQQGNDQPFLAHRFASMSIVMRYIVQPYLTLYVKQCCSDRQAKRFFNAARATGAW